jgi:hypothetical protein
MTMMTTTKTTTTKYTANNMRRKWTGFEGKIKNIQLQISMHYVLKQQALVI